MKPYFQDNHVTLYNSDCRAMAELPDESVQCVVTSPPYFGLRKYSGEQKLDGWSCAYGLEPTPELYVQHTIEILREVRRVLRKDGVVFWNIGDSYNGAAVNQSGNHGYKDGRHNRGKRFSVGGVSGLKPKDLCLIPFRVAIAAQEDGWWVRSDVIWSKPNPMPESVTDRPTSSHEYILMLTKSAKYYWDASAVREPNSQGSIERFGITDGGQTKKWNTDNNKRDGRDDGTKSSEGFRDFVPVGRNLRSVWEFPTQPFRGFGKLDHFAVFPEKLPETCIKAASREGDLVLDPFSGAGTTICVAKKLNRKAVGYEISEEYCQLALERNRQGAMI